MSKEKLNIIYTAKEIENYFSGKLSNVQMHAMEKAALDDPFLAEAMEGYEGMQGKDWNSYLAAVRTQVAEAGSVAKVIPLHKSTGKWWKVAAAILIIGAGTALTFILTNNKNTKSTGTGENIAQVNKPAADNDTSTANATLRSAVKPEEAVTAGMPKENSGSASDVTAKNNPPVKENTAAVKATETIARNQNPEPKRNDADGIIDKKAVAVVTTPPTASVVNPIPSGSETANAQSKELAKQNNAAGRVEQPLNHNFIAQVVAPDNSPLPFSNISIKSENFGTYADVKGNFRLVSSDTVITIEVKSAGYLPRTFSLRSSLAQNKIILQEDDVAIKDKMVIQNTNDVGTVRKSHKARLVMDSVINAEPADGWANYNTYIANNIDIPDDILKKGLHGEVEISFDVKANGAITNIKVDKSLGNDYDDAARRLIEQGPQWKVKKGKKTSAKVKVQF